MERTEFKEKAKKSIDDIFARIDELEAKKDNAKDNLKEKYQEIIENLKEKRDDLKLKYKNLEESSDERWSQAKEDFSRSAEFFRDGFSKLFSLFK